MFKNDLSYAAGVLDAVGRFYIGASGAHVRTLKLHPVVVGRLVSILGGVGDPLQSTWRCPAGQQREVCAKLMPYLVARRDEASVVLQYRLTQPVRKRGWKVTDAVKRFREKLRGLATHGKPNA